MLFILLVILALDFSLRLWVGRVSQSRRFEAPIVSEMEPVASQEQVLGAMRSWLPPTLGGSGVAEKPLYLVGIIGPPSDPTAVIGLGVAGQSSEFSKVRSGETVEGWKVDQVTRRSVSLSREGETKVIELFPRPAGVLSQ
jgi:hypothetical protein